MSNQVVKVRREMIAACMTCPLCNNLLRDATTISECLHTFCRKCIYKKISAEELECCPICSTYLGCDPLEKLRPDHNLQDVRSKIFPSKRRKLEAPEVVPLVSTSPIRKKERSLSSLVVNTPRVSSQATTTGRRTKSVARRAATLRSSIFSTEKPGKKEEDFAEERPGRSSPPKTLHEYNQIERQNSPSAEPSNALFPMEETEAQKGKNDLWEPLTCLVEVANRTKSFKSNAEGAAVKLELTDVPESKAKISKTKVKEHKRKSNIQDKKNMISSTFLESAKTKKLRRIHRKRSRTFGDSSIPSQAVLKAASVKRAKTGPIWFSLVAAKDQKGDAPLPQISTSYLRIKDGKVPVNFIQKYLMRKLDLSSEDEVEIKCMGKPVLPTLELRNLVDSWLQTVSTSRKILASVGSSAKDFVMVLAYARKGSEL